MIVREFLDDPSMPFDYYNDYKDTLNHLKWLAHNSFLRKKDAKTAIQVLEKGREDYVAGLLNRD